MTTFFDLAAARCSIRNYKPQPVENDIIRQILEAGRAAPTACNNQPHRIRVVSGDDLAKIDDCTSCRFGAPVVFLICYDNTKCWRRKFDGAASGEVDASIVTTHMMFAAHALGLGTCWVMHFDPQKTADRFALPAHIIPVAMLPLGYPAEHAAPAPSHGDRLPLEELLLQ